MGASSSRIRFRARYQKPFLHKKEPLCTVPLIQENGPLHSPIAPKPQKRPNYIEFYEIGEDKSGRQGDWKMRREARADAIQSLLD
jgi:hypothetical protein